MLKRLDIQLIFTLGQVQDLDVLQQTLMEQYATNLSGSELEHLKPVIDRLTRARQRAFNEASPGSLRAGSILVRWSGSLGIGDSGSKV